jgi:pyruvate-formate lyase-activating enzyme
MIQHQLKHAVRGNARYPFVLMLEPLYTCNLHCIGCSIERHTGKLKDRLPLERCLEAVEVSGAPIVSICGGEPLIYPELPELVGGIIERKRHVYLCTNALLADEKLFDAIPPHRRLTVNVHLDGMRETHDFVCDKEGVFDKAVRMVAEAKSRGYHVITNTTVFKETRIEEIEELCELLTGLPVRVRRPGHLSHPAGHAGEVPARAGDITALPPHLDADVPRVRRRSARVSMLAVEHRHLHPSRLEGSLLPDRQESHLVVGRVLERDGLGVLGEPQRPALPELRDALRFRGVGGSRAAETPRRHGSHGRLEPVRLNSPGSRRSP